MAPKPKETTPVTPTTTVPSGVEAELAKLRNKIASMGGTVTVPAGAVSPSSRSAIGVKGTQMLDPMTGKTTGYFGYTKPQQLPQMGGFEPAQTLQTQPKYFSGDEDMIAKYSTEEIATIQYNMAKNGLISRKYTPGVVDDKTRTGFRKLLGMANRQGLDWVEAMGVAAATAEAEPPPTYQMSNPDDLKIVFRKAAQEMLGRNLQDGDLNRLVQTFQQQEVEYQKRISGGGQVASTPSATTFATRNIEKDFGEEVNTNKMENIFASIDRALTGGQQ